LGENKDYIIQIPYLLWSINCGLCCSTWWQKNTLRKDGTKWIFDIEAARNVRLLFLSLKWCSSQEKNLFFTVV